MWIKAAALAPAERGGRRRVPAGAPLLARQRGAHPFTVERPLTLEWPTGHSTCYTSPALPKAAAGSVPQARNFFEFGVPKWPIP